MSIAQKYLKSYRIWRGQGYTVRQARAIAHFGIVAMSGGRTNLRMQNRARKYKSFWS